MMRLHPQRAQRRTTSAAPEEPWADRIEGPEVARSGHDGHLGSHAEYRPGAPAEESNRLTIFEPAGMISSLGSGTCARLAAIALTWIKASPESATQP